MLPVSFQLKKLNFGKVTIIGDETNYQSTFAQDKLVQDMFVQDSRAAHTDFGGGDKGPMGNTFQ